MSRLDIRRMVDWVCPVRDVAIASHGRVIRVLLANRLTSPQPLSHIKDWTRPTAPWAGLSTRWPRRWLRRRVNPDVDISVSGALFDCAGHVPSARRSGEVTPLYLARTTNRRISTTGALRALATASS
jgi:hypothetical protein